MDEEIPQGKRFASISLTDMKTWLSILLVMCLVHLPALPDYWKLPKTTEGIYGNQFIRNRMGRDRWSTIENALHPDIDDLMEQFRTVNQKYYQPTKQLSIDETLFLYKGRVRFRQRMPLKPQSTGLKYFVLADVNGFIVDAFLYKGKETREMMVEGDKTSRKEGSTKNIIKYFLKRLKNKGHILFMDKYYGGLEVMDVLIENGHFGVLACQGNRPTELFNTGLAAGKCK